LQIGVQNVLTGIINENVKCITKKKTIFYSIAVVDIIQMIYLFSDKENPLGLL